MCAPETVPVATYPPKLTAVCPIPTSKAQTCPLSIRLLALPEHLHAAAAKTMRDPMVHIFDPQDIAQVYLSPHPYRSAFEESLVIGKSRLRGLPTAGMSLKNENGRLQLLDIKPSSPAARIPRWRSRIRGAWLVRYTVTTYRITSDTLYRITQVDYST